MTFISIFSVQKKIEKKKTLSEQIENSFVMLKKTPSF